MGEAKWIEYLSPILLARMIQTHGYEPKSSQTNDSKIDKCHFQARSLALLGEDKDWLAQCQDNMAEITVLAAWSPRGTTL